jgi:hypothetical protein
MTEPRASAGACLVRTSLSPSEMAEMFENRRRNGGAEAS